MLVSTASWANQIDYQLSLNSEAISQSVEDIDGNETFDADNMVVTPSLSLLYSGKRVQGFWRATHNQVYRSIDDNSTTQSYSNYNYGGEVAIIDKVLSFRANGALTNRAPNINSFQTDDFLLNPENLSKTRRNSASMNLNIPRGEYLGISSILSYSESSSERTETGFTGLENSQTSLTTNIVTGNNFKRIYGLVNTNVSLQKRPQGNGDALSRQAQAELSFNLISDIGLTFTATNEGNQVSSDNNIFSLARNFSTYGAGLSWRESDNRFLTVTVNHADGNQLGQAQQDNQTFVGINTQWQFTPRTSLSARYGRRVFGESGEFSLSHQIKRLRTQLTYTEEITSFSSLTSNPSSLGVFVCADGARDLTACFQPSSLNYQLGPNEEFVQFSDQNTEISDELILRQALSWQMGISKRRTNVSFNGRYSLNEYLESDRLNRTYSAGIVLGFGIGQKTNFTWNSQYAVSNNRFEGTSGESTSLTSTVSISRTIGRYLNLNLNFRFLDLKTEGDFSSSSSFGVAGINGDLKDRRISIGLRYQYGSR
jgi:uncharacterized protein (PEP-CTERM system associated)